MALVEVLKRSRAQSNPHKNYKFFLVQGDPGSLSY